MTSFFKKSGSTRGNQTSLRDLVGAQSATPLANIGGEPKASQETDFIRLPIGSFRSELRTHLKAVDTDDVTAWVKAINHAASLGGRATPSLAWLQTGSEKLVSLDKSVFAAACTDWVRRFEPNPHNPDASLDVLRGLLCLCTEITDDRLTMAICRYAMFNFRKIAGLGPHSKKMGNTCVAVLEAMAINGHDLAISELTVIHRKSIYPSVRNLTEAALSRIAAHRNITPHDLAEICLPTFGFDKGGTWKRKVSGYGVELQIKVAKVAIQWTDPDGKPLKTAPKATRQSNKEDVQEVSNLRASLEGLLATQRDCLEATYLNARDWSFEEWQQRLFVHPIRRSLTENLVWYLDVPAGSRAFMVLGGMLVDCTGHEIAQPSAQDRVRLWHPTLSDQSEQNELMEIAKMSGVVEAFPQMTRTKFALLSAEKKTHTYSNRFAAHVLYHHQFAAVCKKMDWQYKANGMLDTDASTAIKVLSRWDMQAEFQVVPVVNSDEQKRAQGPSKATTDRLFFQTNSGSIVPLEDVSDICFSEVMREVDILIAISSKSDDQNWSDKDLVRR